MILTIILIYIPIYHAMYLYTYEFYDAIHGSLSLKDLYLPPDTNTTEEEEIDDKEQEDGNKEWFFPLIGVKATAYDHDLLDFNEISKKLTNISRRGTWDTFYGHNDPEDWLYGKFGTIEPKKKMMLIKTNIQFLIHTRYKVYGILEQIHTYRHDKRYKLGYLFNRLRRLLSEMRKIISTASQQHTFSTWFRSLRSLMRLYEQVVRYDVDIRDTAEYIRRIYYTENEAGQVKGADDGEFDAAEPGAAAGGEPGSAPGEGAEGAGGDTGAGGGPGAGGSPAAGGGSAEGGPAAGGGGAGGGPAPGGMGAGGGEG